MGKRKRYICHYCIPVPFFCIAGGSFQCQFLLGIIVLIVTVKPQNIHRFLICTGNHGVAKPHFSVFRYFQDSLGSLCLHQTVVNHIAAHRHCNIISASLRFLGRDLSRSILRHIQFQGISYCVFDRLGRIGCPGHSIHFLDALFIRIFQTQESVCNPINGRLQLSFIYVCIRSPEIVAGNLHIRDFSLFYGNGCMDVILSKLHHMGSAAFGIRSSSACGCPIEIQRLAEQTCRCHSSQKQGAESFYCPFVSHDLLHKFLFLSSGRQKSS